MTFCVRDKVGLVKKIAFQDSPVHIGTGSVGTIVKVLGTTKFYEVKFGEGTLSVTIPMYTDSLRLIQKARGGRPTA